MLLSGSSRKSNFLSCSVVHSSHKKVPIISDPEHVQCYLITAIGTLLCGKIPWNVPMPCLGRVTKPTRQIIIHFRYSAFTRICQGSQHAPSTVVLPFGRLSLEIQHKQTFYYVDNFYWRNFCRLQLAETNVCQSASVWASSFNKATTPSTNLCSL